MTEPASIRYKNPGAMWPGKIATKWGSKRYVTLNDGQGNKIAVFDNWVDGICAQLDMWRTLPNYKNKRFADAIAIWSGHNNVPSYIAYCKARVPGLTENTVMNDVFWRGPMAIPFLKAQSGHEAGKAIPAPDGDWIQAQRRVMDGAAPAPAKEATKAVVVGAPAAGAGAAIKHGVDAGWGAVEWLSLLGGLLLLAGVVYLAWRYLWPRWQEWRAAASMQEVTHAESEGLHAVEKALAGAGNLAAAKPTAVKRRAPRKPPAKPKGKRKATKRKAA